MSEPKNIEQAKAIAEDLLQDLFELVEKHGTKWERRGISPREGYAALMTAVCNLAAAVLGKQASFQPEPQEFLNAAVPTFIEQSIQLAYRSIGIEAEIKKEWKVNDKPVH